MDLLVVDSSIEEEEEDGSGDDVAMAITERTATAEGEASDASNEEGIDALQDGLRHRRKSSVVKGSPRVHLICAWDNEAVAEQNDAAEKVESESGKENVALEKNKKYNTTWLTQYLVLTHRALKNSRAAIFTPLNLIKSAALGIVAGLLWFRLGQSEKYVADRSSYYFFTMTYWVFDAMFQALMTFPSERDVILKARRLCSDCV